MHKSKANSDDAKDIFHLCADELHLLRTAYNTGRYLLNYYQTTVYKNSAYT